MEYTYKNEHYRRFWLQIELAALYLASGGTIGAINTDLVTAIRQCVASETDGIPAFLEAVGCTVSAEEFSEAISSWIAEVETAQHLYKYINRHYKGILPNVQCLNFAEPVEGAALERELTLLSLSHTARSEEVAYYRICDILAIDDSDNLDIRLQPIAAEAEQIYEEMKEFQKSKRKKL